MISAIQFSDQYQFSDSVGWVQRKFINADVFRLSDAEVSREEVGLMKACGGWSSILEGGRVSGGCDAGAADMWPGTT